MDVRHEPIQQEVLNRFISVINDYIKQYTDDLLVNDAVKKQMEEMCYYIFLYSKMEVDVAGILSKHNLLSIDVVLFPTIVDVENQIAMDEDFDKLIGLIRPILNQKEAAQTGSYSKLFQQLSQIMEQVNERPAITPIRNRP